MIRLMCYDSTIYHAGILTISNTYHAAYRNGPGMVPWNIFISVLDSEPRETINLDLGAIHYLDSDATLKGNHDIFHHKVDGDVIVYAQGRNAYGDSDTRQIDLILDVPKVISFTSYTNSYQYDVTEEWTAYVYNAQYYRARVHITMRKTNRKTGAVTTHMCTTHGDAYVKSSRRATADIQSSIGYIQNYLSITPGSDKAKSLKESLDNTLPFGDLCFEACKDARVLDINTIAYLKDIAELNELVQSLVGIYRAVKNPGEGVKQISKTIAKTASGAYLAEHYGLRLTINDTNEIIRGISDIELYRTRRYGAEKESAIDLKFADPASAHAKRRVTLDIDALTSEQASLLMSVNSMKRALLDLDILPTASNIWDLVPFSFVLDWFLPIGDYFEYTESMFYISTLPIRSAFYATKSKWTESDSIALSTGTSFDYCVEHSVYTRECRATLKLPTFRPESPQGLSNHWLEATALFITQALK